MERQQLIKLIDNKGTSSKEETSELWDIVRMFPYFQTARLLLVKSFHNQGSIHFHNELKVAAAYATDRKVLSHLIRQTAETAKQVAQAETNVFVLEQSQPENQFVIPEEPKKEKPIFEIKEDIPSVTERKKEEPVSKTKTREEIKEETKTTVVPSPSSFDEPATTNEEIIRRRLSEILSKNKPEEQEIISDELPKEIISPKEEVAEEKIESPELTAEKEEEPVTSFLDELPAEPIDEIEGLELETIIEENYLSELEKLPEITRPVVETSEEPKSEPVKTGNQELSFIDWLKQKNAKDTSVEEIIDEPVHFHHEKEAGTPALSKTDQPDQVTQSEVLINKFIADKPRIAPVKAEFYSPSNMARLSITDNEDIISETLARIYFDQQNYLKARSCYEKLSLLYPEKSAFFAPLIEKIDNLLKENQM